MMCLNWQVHRDIFLHCTDVTYVSVEKSKSQVSWHLDIFSLLSYTNDEVSFILSVDIFPILPSSNIMVLYMNCTASSFDGETSLIIFWFYRYTRWGLEFFLRSSFVRHVNILSMTCIHNTRSRRVVFIYFVTASMSFFMLDGTDEKSSWVTTCKPLAAFEWIWCGWRAVMRTTSDSKMPLPLLLV